MEFPGESMVNHWNNNISAWWFGTWSLASGNLLHSYWTWHFLMGKSTIFDSAIFNSYVTNYQMVFFMICPFIGNAIAPTDEAIFFRGVGWNHQAVINMRIIWDMNGGYILGHTGNIWSNIGQDVENPGVHVRKMIYLKRGVSIPLLVYRKVNFEGLARNSQEVSRCFNYICFKMFYIKHKHEMMFPNLSYMKLVGGLEHF